MSRLLAVESVCMATSSHRKVDDNVFNLWHARLVHMNHSRMKNMSKMSLISRCDTHHNKCGTCERNVSL